MQDGVDRGRGHVHDGRVEHGHELADEHDGQDETGTHRAFAAGQQAGPGVTSQDVGHDLSLASTLSRYQDTTYPGTNATWLGAGLAGRVVLASQRAAPATGLSSDEGRSRLKSGPEASGEAEQHEQ